MRRKDFILIMVFILILSVFFTNKISAVGIDLTYWYSNADEINLWGNRKHSYFIHPHESQLTQQQLSNFSANAYSKWNSSTGITGTNTSNQSNADVDILGLSRSSFRNLGIPDNAIGIGFVDNVSFQAEGYYGLQTKYIYKVTGKGYLYFVWDSTTSSFGNTDWNKLFVHEAGHVFGYIGHYEINGVMKSNFLNITTTTPSLNNSNHLRQLY